MSVPLPAEAPSPSTGHVSVEEYLRTSYRPDRELVEGELREKGMPTRLHGYVQSMIGHWFAMHMEEWGVAPESEVRTRVRPANFRLPDVALTRFHTAWSKTQDEPPVVAIEILSDDDRYADLQGRARDLTLMGVGNVWLIDPEERVASIWSERGVWEPAAELTVPSGPIHLDLDWLWGQVDKRIQQTGG